MVDYQVYLHSPGWRERRGERLRFAAGRCEICNSSRRVDVHHRTYERLGRELLSDLVALCRRCHGLFHDVMVAPPAKQVVAPPTDRAHELVNELALAERLNDQERIACLVEEKLAMMSARRDKESAA